MRVYLRGAGPVARAIVEAWIDLQVDEAGGELAWAADPWAVDSEVSQLRAALRRWSRRPEVELEGRALKLADGRSVSFAVREGTPAALAIDAEGWRPKIEPSGVRIDAAAVLAAAPLLELIEGGPGLRWALVEVIEGRREDRAAGAGLGAEHDDGGALAAALGRRLPKLAGKLACARLSGPQLGESVHLSLQLAAGAQRERLRDLLVDHARAPLEAAPGARSDEALGRAAVLVDVDPQALVGVGPLVRLLAHYDPAAMVASALWRALA